ncbi:MAG: two-component regulator propeller domain-containing protein [Woeseiaceae bacterium]|nr:two-component regulator propeller domain-containing protein [Woeseiaceae bacterium]
MSAQNVTARVMPMKNAALLLAILVLAGGVACIRPAAARVATPMHFTHLSVDDGLSQNNVQVIFQDSTGFMWFGTESGLNRYDGYEIRRYHRSRFGPDGLHNDFIWAIAEDGDGNLWLATKGGGVARWDRDSDTFTSFRHDPADPDSLASDDIRTLLLREDGTIWVGTRDRGLDLLDPDTGKATHYRHDAEDPSSISGNTVYAVLEDSRGHVWVGTDTGLNRLLPGTGQFHRYQHEADDANSLSANDVRTIFEDSAGTIWIGTATGGLNRLRSIAGEFTRFRHVPADELSLSSDNVRAIFEDDARRMWVGTTAGLNLLQRAESNFIRYAHEADNTRSLMDSYVNSIYQDRSGLLWIGTRSAGVSKWNPRSWTLGPYAQSWLSDADVTSFASDGRGTVWVGTLGYGLARLDESAGQVTRYRHEPGTPGAISDDRVMALLIDRDGMLWAGTMAGGLNRIDPATGRATVFRHDPADDESLPANGVMALHEDRAGQLWVGTYGGGVGILDKAAGRFRVFDHHPEDPATLNDARASAITETADGTIWVGTFGGGINRFDPATGTFERFKSDASDPAGLPSDMVYTLHEDVKGRLWAGTAGGGLTRVRRSGDDVTFETISRVEGLPSDDVYGVQSDASGRLWISTNSGLARYEPENATIKTFHKSHGLQGEEFNYGAHHRSPDGKLYFGGAGGFNAFFPDLVEVSRYVPPVVLTSVTISGEPLDSTRSFERLEGISLDHTDRVLNLGFAALDFTSPTRNSFAYRLEGFDTSWIDLGTQHHVTLTNLDAGEYRLHVRAQTSDGSPGTAEFVMPIRVAAAPWATQWAFAGYGFMGLGTLLLAWRSHRRKYLREVEYSRRLENDVADRTRELERRNADLEVATRAKSDFLARMSHEIRTPMNGMLGMTQLLMGTPLDGKQRRFAHTIRSSAESLLEIINDILDFSKIEAGRLRLEYERFNVNELVEDTVDLFAAAATEKGLELICSTPPGPELEVDGDAARLKQVLINLLANAVKFTRDGEIVVHYFVSSQSRERAELTFEVVDTGIGIKPENLESIFESFSQEDGTTARRFGGTGLGLAICQQLVEMMGGEIGVDSTPGEGSRFWFRVSLAKLGEVAAPEDVQRQLAGSKVLLVDDNRSCRSVIGGYLRALGMQVSTAHDGDSALRKLHSASYADGIDMVLLDGELRGQQSAFDVVHAIRRNPTLGNVRIVVMSTALSAEEDQRLARDGVHGHVAKPVRQSALIKSLSVNAGSFEITAKIEQLDLANLPAAERLGGRVLLVEDNPVNQTVAVGMLEEFGCDTVVAFNGEDAIAQLSKDRFDLVLMDCEMPVMDGFTATAAIRERIAGSESVPIIAVTANAIEGDRERCLAAGMQDYLPKPITVEKLHGKLRKWLPGDRPRAASPSDILDPASLDSIRNLRGVGGERMVRRVVSIYLSSSAKVHEDLASAVSAQDSEALRQAAHALKSSSQNVGAKRLAGLCQQLEEMARSGSLDGAGSLIERIDVAYRETVDALRDLLPGREH